MSLLVLPISLRDANAFIKLHHRHHKPVPGCKFAISVCDEYGVIRGVSVVGRPVARMSDDGHTAEVNRVATDGTRNACSMLYGASWRAARAMGYRRLITYTLPEEGGASLRGAGFKLIGEAGGGKWSRLKRLREDDHPQQVKLKWELQEKV